MIPWWIALIAFYVGGVVVCTPLSLSAGKGARAWCIGLGWPLFLGWMVMEWIRNA